MNNEPVAWMFRGYLYEKDPSNWTVHEHPNVPVIPLYTHPVKEQDESFDRTASHMAGEYVSYTKELTDEEIIACIDESEPDTADMIRFAKAILRKAQEK